MKLASYNKLLIVLMLFGLMSCQTFPPKDERMNIAGHVNEPVPKQQAVKADIPPLVQQLPVIAPPKPAEKLQTFTVVVSDVPANELLFALARDARLNLDIDPKVNGRVSINAIDQTLPQILNRIARQTDLRYYVDGPNLVVTLDKAFTREYRIDYLNMSRKSTSNIALATQISSTGSTTSSGGGNNSSTNITNKSDNNFWDTLEKNLKSLISTSEGGAIISNRETGTISVRATSKDHKKVQAFLDKIMASARQQVLIEATVVEVTLNDDYQAGVDWSAVASGNGWSLANGLATAGNLATNSALFATYNNVGTDRTVRASIKALDAFGDVSVMSSPKIMALNNQTSILKVVDNTVYFNIDAQREAATANSAAVTTYSTTINTVPVGFVMNVTPFITENDEVILNVRPTISRIVGYAKDPNPDLAAAGVENNIPQIQVREMESVLRVSSGDTAVIGGLMQDSSNQTRSGLPGLSESQDFGFLFGQKQKNLDKTELVIFLRPRIINSANVNGELSDFQRFLKPKSLQQQ